MDLSTLSNLFATTYSQDVNARRAAELQIIKIANEEGMISALLKIIGTDGVEITTRQAAAVWLKNRTHTYYDVSHFRLYPPSGSAPAAATTGTGGNVPTIHESDRVALRTHLLSLITHAPTKSISLQLAHTLKFVIITDFPNGRWDSLVDDIKRFLLSPSGDIREVRAGCVAALEAVKAFRYRQKNDIMTSLVSQLFPTLAQIATQTLSSYNSTINSITSGSIHTPPPAPFPADAQQQASYDQITQQIPTLLHLILKTYRTSVILNLSKHQQDQASLVPWGQLLFGVLNIRIPKWFDPRHGGMGPGQDDPTTTADDGYDRETEQDEEREESAWWKAKKWACACLSRLFHRFGNPSQLPSSLKDEYGVFAQHFVTMFAPEILKNYLGQVDLYVKGEEWLSNKCQFYIFQFFTECVKPKSTWSLLKPHYQTLVEQFIFPKLSFSKEKLILWNSDKIEFLRCSVDEYETFATPISSATSFLISGATNRTKGTFMPILQFVNRVVAGNPTPDQLFGALTFVSTLAEWIMKHPEVKGGMENFVMQHVAPIITGSQGPREGWLRGAACELVGNVAKAGLEYENPQNLHTIFQAVFTLLDDPDFPVSVHAALALTALIQAYPSVHQAVSPQVGKVIQDLLKMTDEMDADILNRSMEVMVEKYQEELTPVAGELAARLCQSYMRLVRESIQNEQTASGGAVDYDAILNDDMNDDKTFAAMGIAKAIYTLIAAIDSSPDILKNVQEVIIPIIVFTLQNKILDLFDSMYELVDSLTYKTTSISPNFWPVFELTYNLFKTDAIDFLDEMLPSLDNFVSFGSDVVKSRPDYKQMLLDIYTTSMASEQLGENDRVNGCKLAESMLLNLRGDIDDALQPIIATALSHLDNANTISLKLANLEVLVNACLYNPSAALHLMEATSPGSSRTFFDKWFKAINSDNGLPRVHDKKLTILALCSLIEVPGTSIPDNLREGWPGLLTGLLKVIEELPKAIEARKELESALEEEEDDDEVDEIDNFNLTGDDEDVWDEDSAYLELLASEGARQRERSEKTITEAEVDDDDDSDDDEEIEEEIGFISAIDTINPYITFKKALKTFELQNNPVYQSATSSLELKQQMLLMDVLRMAESQETGAA